MLLGLRPSQRDESHTQVYLTVSDNELDEDPNADLFSDISSVTGQSTVTSSSISSRMSRSTG